MNTTAMKIMRSPCLGERRQDPEELLRRLREAIENTKVVGLTKEAFERTKRKKIGGYLRMLIPPKL